MHERGDAPYPSGGNDASRRAATTSVAATAVFLAVLASGCASTYAAFKPEAEIPECAAWLREGVAVPVSVVRERVDAAAGGPFSIEIEERGSGDRDRVLVLVHGVLSDRRAWRYMVGRLAAEHDLMLVDLPGCGGSDRPAPETMGARGYDPDTLAAAVLEAVGARLRRRAHPASVTLVGHSLGSAVVLRALAKPRFRTEHAGVLDRVDGAVLVSPVDCSYAKRDPTFERLAGVSGVEIEIGNLLGMVREQIAESVRNGVEIPAEAPREEVDRLHEILSDPERRAAAQSMLRSAVPFTRDMLPDWDRIEVLERQTARVAVPCLVVCGGRDDAIPEALAFKLCVQLPDARLRVLSRSGHSIPTERPEECAALVLEFIESRGDGWAAYEEAPREFPGSRRGRVALGAP